MPSKDWLSSHIGIDCPSFFFFFSQSTIVLVSFEIIALVILSVRGFIRFYVMTICSKELWSDRICEPKRP